MDFLLTIKTLYAANGFFAVFLYLPQILKAWRNREHARSLSLVTFGGWSIGAGISTLYAWLFLHDLMFAVVSLGNLVGCGSVFALVAGRRLASR